MSVSHQPPENHVSILVVEDSPTQARRLEYILQSRGYRVMVAADGRAALDLLQDAKPQMVVSDVIMPEMDGYELCRSIKTDRAFEDVPVILVTTLSDPTDVIRGLECGADNFVLKPYDERYLLGRVQYLLLNRQMRQAEQSGVAVEIFFNGRKHVITADRLQILNLLLSTYEVAIQRNRELTAAEEEMRRAESFLNSIIENVPSTIFVKDAELRYVRVNRAFEELIGRPRAEILGRTDYDLFPAEEADLFVAKDREALESQMIVEAAESPVHTASGAVRLLHTKKLAVRAGGTDRFVLGISEDITARKADEQAIAAAKQEAERANRAKSQFLSRMSHDLRTPLNAILGFAQLLEIDVTTADQRENARQIVKAGDHLLQLINEVLDIARIESGHLSLSPEPVPVDDVVQHAVDLVRPMAAERAVVFDVDTRAIGGRHVMADRQRLSQVLLNLLSNAVKYNRVRGRVTVTANRVGERLRIGVTDTGAGISPEKLRLLFQPFERLGAEQTGIEGTGLGLTLAKVLTEAMGGMLGVESVVDRGSTFWVEFAHAERGVDAGAAPARVSAHASTEDSGVTGTVLYIEDNVSNRRLMERVFARRAGVRLLAVPQGQTGLELARAEQPDLILLDLHLPDINGEEVLRRLWEDPRTRTIPVAVLSADAMPSQARRLMAAGASAYLTKPLNIGEVLELVDRTLGRTPPAS